MDRLDGHLVLEFRIRSFRQVHIAHPSAAQGMQNSIWAYAVTYHWESMLRSPGKPQTTRGLLRRGSASVY